MAADFFLGESLVGDGNEVAHIDLIIGSKSGPAGAAFGNALANNKDGFTTLLAVVAPNLPAKPDTLLFNKVTIKGAKQAVQMFGPAQAAVARAVVDSLESGVIPKDKADDLLHPRGRVHPLGSRRRPEDLRLQLQGDQGIHRARAEGQADGRGSDRRIEDGEAPVQPEVSQCCEAGSSEDPASISTQVLPVQKLLLQLDSSTHPSVFDRVVAFDGGADQVMSYGGVTDDAVRDLVHGAIFTRGPKDLHNTAIFVGGTDMAVGERLLPRGHQGVLRSDARVGDARLQRIEHHRRGRGRHDCSRQRVMCADGAWSSPPAPDRSACAPRGCFARAGAQTSSSRRESRRIRPLLSALQQRFGGGRRR